MQDSISIHYRQITYFTNILFFYFRFNTDYINSAYIFCWIIKSGFCRYVIEGTTFLSNIKNGSHGPERRIMETPWISYVGTQTGLYITLSPHMFVLVHSMVKYWLKLISLSPHETPGVICIAYLSLVPFICLTAPQFSACLKPTPRFRTTYVLLFSMLYDLEWDVFCFLHIVGIVFIS